MKEVLNMDSKFNIQEPKFNIQEPKEKDIIEEIQEMRMRDYRFLGKFLAIGSFAMLYPEKTEIIIQKLTETTKEYFGKEVYHE
jgi:hypothetical protein